MDVAVDGGCNTGWMVHGCVGAWMRWCMDGSSGGCVGAWMRWCMDALVHGCVGAWMHGRKCCGYFCAVTAGVLFAGSASPIMAYQTPAAASIHRFEKGWVGNVRPTKEPSSKRNSKLRGNTVTIYEANKAQLKSLLLLAAARTAHKAEVATTVVGVYVLGVGRGTEQPSGSTGC
eukprot:12226-Chlamydomonas_euryale.AAC.2